tara:strand:- start:58 stop:1356 length:1299 start_codon:yes stop_codon:yes gene_type:complete
MATFSQFNKKYITEKKSLHGDSLNRNIIKKLVTDPIENIKKKQIDIDKKIAADLSRPKVDNTSLKSYSKKIKITDKTVENFKKKLTKLGSQKGNTDPNKSTLIKGTSDENVVRSTKPTDDEGKFRRKANTKYKAPSKTQSQNIQTNSIKNQVRNRVDNSRTINKEINPNVVKGTDPKDINKKFGSSKPTGTFTDDLPKAKELDQKLTKNLTKPKQGAEITYKNIEKKLKPKTRIPRTIVKSYTTQPTSPTDFAGKLKRGAELTGIKSLEPKQQIGDKLKNIPQSKITKNIIKKTPKKLVFNRALSGLGRVAGGAFAVKDFMDTARKEKALGRSKTAARLRGASKAIGGYVGGGIGALAGGLAGGGVASAGLGIAGGIAGYSAGSKIGDQIYKTGRNLVTGKKTFKNLRKDINKGAKNVYKGTKNFFDTSGNP